LRWGQASRWRAPSKWKFCWNSVNSEERKYAFVSCGEHRPQTCGWLNS
jgi:hypothetical protein